MPIRKRPSSSADVPPMKHRPSVAAMEETKMQQPAASKIGLQFPGLREVVAAHVFPYLDICTACALESASKSWPGHVVNWRDAYFQWFGMCPDAESVRSTQAWKGRFLQDYYLRIIPGQRSLGIKLPCLASALAVTPGLPTDMPVNFRRLCVQTPNGELKLKMCFEDDIVGTELSGEDVILWDDGTTIQAKMLSSGMFGCPRVGQIGSIGVFRPDLGMLVIPGRPDIVGIRVGISLQNLLTLANFDTSAVVADLGDAAEGPLFAVSGIPSVMFALDAREVEDWGGDCDVQWVLANMHLPIAMILA